MNATDRAMKATNRAMNKTDRAINPTHRAMSSTHRTLDPTRRAMNRAERTTKPADRTREWNGSKHDPPKAAGRGTEDGAVPLGQQLVVVQRPHDIPIRPTRAQRFFASPWFGRCWFGGAGLLGAVVALVVCLPSLSEQISWMQAGTGLLILACAAALGFFLAAFPGWLILGPLYAARVTANGGPFAPGARVLILSGPHRGQIATVAERWQGECVRVELGEAARKHHSDVFGQIELLGVKG